MSLKRQENCGCPSNFLRSCTPQNSICTFHEILNTFHGNSSQSGEAKRNVRKNFQPLFLIWPNLKLTVNLKYYLIQDNPWGFCSSSENWVCIIRRYQNYSRRVILCCNPIETMHQSFGLYCKYHCGLTFTIYKFGSISLWKSISKWNVHYYVGCCSVYLYIY